MRSFPILRFSPLRTPLPESPFSSVCLYFCFPSNLPFSGQISIHFPPSAKFNSPLCLHSLVAQSFFPLLLFLIRTNPKVNGAFRTLFISDLLLLFSHLSIFYWEIREFTTNSETQIGHVELGRLLAKDFCWRFAKLLWIRFGPRQRSKQSSLQTLLIKFKCFAEILLRISYVLIFCRRFLVADLLPYNFSFWLKFHQVWLYSLRLFTFPNYYFWPTPHFLLPLSLFGFINFPSSSWLHFIHFFTNSPYFFRIFELILQIYCNARFGIFLPKLHVAYISCFMLFVSLLNQE